MRSASTAVLMLILASTSVEVRGVLADERSPASSEADPAGLEYFEKHIRPVLIDSCYKCHSSSSRNLRGGLRVDGRNLMLKGGDSGAAIEPGQPDESLLLDAIQYDGFEMPPQGKLSADVIAKFEHWIKIGAPAPDGRDTDSSSSDKSTLSDHWAFNALRRPALPEISDQTWGRNEIDRFILARLENAGIAPAQEASRPTLIRRIYFDLLGVPPTAETIRRFVNDGRPNAYEALVDRLLADPRFGERWGRHWLDVVRFSESSGGGRTLIFNDAWKYRDYVIRAWNADRGFDEFIREQLAGDLLSTENRERRTEQLTATGFLALGPHNYELQDKELLRLEVIDEQISTIGKAFMGMTVGCARCHDHKFDPIPTRDYYALAGIFWNTNSLVPGNVSGFVTRKLPVPESHQASLDEHTAKKRELEAEVARLTRELRTARGAEQKAAIPVSDLAGTVLDDTKARTTGRWIDSQSVSPHVGSGYIHDGQSDQRMTAEFRVALDPGNYEIRLGYTSSSNRPTNAKVTVTGRRTEVARINQRRKPTIDGLFQPVMLMNVDRELIVEISNEGADGTVIVDALQIVPASGKDSIGAFRPAPENQETLAQQKKIQAELEQAKKRLKSHNSAAPPSAPIVMSVEEQKSYEDFHICVRGNIHSVGETVPRGFLSRIELPDSVEIPSDVSGRLQLVDWLCSAQHPLTSRVIVNRLWQHLMGRGIVDSVDNFGAMGNPPTHPELLDWMAVTLQEDDWSLKSAIRRILTSQTYRQSSTTAASVVAADPSNILYSRSQRRRLDAECLRDAMLVIGGQVDRTMGGKTIPPGLRSELGYEYRGMRRSIYVPMFRNTVLDVFDAFDMADPNLVTGKRSSSTRSTQALFFMNSPFVSQLADDCAAKLIKEPTDASPADRVERLFLTVLSRKPTEQELAVVQQFLNDELEAGQAEQDAWAAVIHGLFASIDFRFVD